MRKRSVILAMSVLLVILAALIGSIAWFSHLRGQDSGFVFGQVLAGCFLSEGAFQVLEDFITASQYRFGDAGQLGNVDAVAFVGSACDDLVQKDDIAGPFTDRHVEIFNIDQQPFKKLKVCLKIEGSSLSNPKINPASIPIPYL